MMVLTKVFACVLLFIIKCRFPAKKSIADIIRGRYGEDTLVKIRRLEKLDFKLRKCDLDLEFLEICLENKIVPNFLKFKVPNSALKDSKVYRDCQQRLLKQELSNKKRSFSKLLLGCHHGFLLRTKFPVLLCRVSFIDTRALSAISATLARLRGTGKNVLRNTHIDLHWQGVNWRECRFSPLCNIWGLIHALFHQCLEKNFQ